MEKKFKSKYKGWCWFCQTRIKKHQLILWNTETKKAKHFKCPEKRPTKERQSGRAKFRTGRER